MDIQVYATLRDVVGGKTISVDVPASTTVADLLERVCAVHPALRAKILDAHGNLQPSIHVLVNGREVRHLDGLLTRVSTADTVRLLPPVGGGGCLPGRD
jgi:molybdopterin synthase sulfur carrier subunit